MRRRGFSLIEMMIVLVITSIVILGVGSALLASRDSLGETNVEHDLVSGADRVLAVLENDLRTASMSGSSISVTSTTFTFKPITGFNTTTNQMTFGPAVTWQFVAVPAATATADGIPGELQLQRVVNGVAVTLASNLTNSSTLLDPSGNGAQTGRRVAIANAKPAKDSSGTTLGGFGVVTAVSSGADYNLLTVNFFVAKQAKLLSSASAQASTAFRDVRYRLVSRSYNIQGGLPATPSSGGGGGGGSGTSGDTNGTGG
jgi:prepilin-type N-terminal cleavage/methylation domain-containing protein